MKETKAGTPEYLSRDILEKDFVSTFLSFYRLQFILGSCRIEIKDQFVTSPTRYQKCYTICCILMCAFLNYVVIHTYFGSISDATLYYLTAAGVWIGYAMFVCVILHVRFCNGQANADFFIQMQKLDRLMGLDKNKAINLILKKINKLSLVMLLCAFVIIIVVACSKMSILYLTFVGAVFSQVVIMIEIIYCSNLLIYFVIRLRFLNCIIKNYMTQKKINYNKPLTYNFFSNRNLRQLAIIAHSFPTSDTSAYLKELFDLFTMFQQLYRFQLLVFCLKLVFGSILNFATILFSVQKNVVDIMEVGSMFVFVIIDIFIAIFLGVRLQLFFGEVKETKRLSIAVMAAYSSGQLREKARKMLKMAEETPPRLSIYDMYEMDAGIFLTLFSLITSLIVTLLQFVFL